jgi:hypothetical protein
LHPSDRRLFVLFTDKENITQSSRDTTTAPPD